MFILTCFLGFREFSRRMAFKVGNAQQSHISKDGSLSSPHGGAL